MAIPHHWSQGPMDVEPLNAARTRWQFRWWLEPGEHVGALGQPNSASDDYIARNVDFVLNQVPGTWGKRTGVQFVQVGRLQAAHITLRISNAIPPGATMWAPGWNFTDAQGRNIAQISPSMLYANTLLLLYVVGMEMVGHGCFRMHDMYTPNHSPYVGAMGNWHPADPYTALPSDDEAEDAQLWLQGLAPHVHREPGW